MTRPDVPDPEFTDAFLRAARGAGLSGLVSYEDRAVRHVLRALRLPRLAAEIAREVESRTGTLACTFGVFAEFLPGFPVRFGVARIRNVKFLAIPDLFDRFGTTVLYRNLSALADAVGFKKPIGLIFRYTGDAELKGPKGGQFMILHTAGCLQGDFAATRILGSCRFGRRQVAWCLQTLDSFLYDFPWEPEGG
jgi:hypothetical protein